MMMTTVDQLNVLERLGVLSPVCRLAELQPERGVAALLPDGAQVAVFRTHDDALYAVSNVDPFSSAAVLSRGIIGDRGGVPVVTSPIYKQAFDLRTGRCLDDDTVTLRVYAVHVLDGMVLVGSP
jgi:nitrite reductase (NADH) small subunit